MKGFLGMAVLFLVINANAMTCNDAKKVVKDYASALSVLKDTGALADNGIEILALDSKEPTLNDYKETMDEINKIFFIKRYTDSMIEASKTLESCI